MIYCLVPRELANKLQGTLRRFYEDDERVHVIVERRMGERRSGAEQRADGLLGTAFVGRRRVFDRRKIRNEGGRRLAERRAPVVSALREIPLPRGARPHRDRLVFVGAVPQPRQQLEDIECARVVTRVQGGDEEAFGELYLHYFDRVYGYLRIVLGSLSDVEEDLQEVFGRLLDSLPQYEVELTPFRMRLAETLLDYTYEHELERTTDPEFQRAMESRVGTSDLHVLEWLTDQDLLSLLERLPVIQRQIVALHYLIGLSRPQIAALLGRREDEVERFHEGALRFVEGCLTSLGRRPGYSGRLAMKRRRPGMGPVVTERRRALGG